MVAGLLALGVVRSHDDDGPSRGEVTLGSGASAGVEDLPPGTTAATTPAGIGEGFAPEQDGRTPLRGFGQVAATITGADGTVCEVCLLAAETPDQRARGLMEVTDPTLGGYDGMVFVYPDDGEGSFWMRNTPLPLSLAYFGSDGALVSTVDMAPCGDVATCPSYPPAGPFRLALEVPQGGLDEVGVIGEATIELTGRTCAVAGTAG